MRGGTVKRGRKSLRDPITLDIRGCWVEQDTAIYSDHSCELVHFSYIIILLLHEEPDQSFTQNIEHVSYSSQHDKVHLNMSVL